LCQFLKPTEKANEQQNSYTHSGTSNRAFCQIQGTEHASDQRSQSNAEMQLLTLSQNKQLTNPNTHHLEGGQAESSLTTLWDD